MEQARRNLAGAALMIGLCAAAAACGGHGGDTGMLPSASRNSSAPFGGSAILRVSLTYAPNRDGVRRAAVTIDERAVAIALGARSCALDADGRICTIAVGVAPGVHLVRLNLYGRRGSPIGSAARLATAGAPAAVAFAASGTPAGILLTPSTIVFTPNPGNGTGTGSAASVYVSALNASGKVIVGSARYAVPIRVQIYEPRSTVRIAGAGGNGRVILLGSPAAGQPLTLTMAGTAYTAPASLVATAGGAGNASALIVNELSTPVPCTPVPAAIGIYVPFALPSISPQPYSNPSEFGYYNLLRVPVWIGARGATHAVDVPVDTGSVGLAIPVGSFISMMGFSPPPSPQPRGTPIATFPSPFPAGVSGPGQPGSITYVSSGNVEIGRWWTVPLTFGRRPHQTATIPMQVLVVEQYGCNPVYSPSKCKNQPLRNAYLGGGNMGVGFADFQGTSPVDAPFLQLARMLDGSIPRRYILNNRGVTFGGTAKDLARFRWIRLTRSTSIEGDWELPTGCLQFPGIKGGFSTCGQFKLDTGYLNSILQMPAGQQPPSLAAYLNAHKPLELVAPGIAAEPALDYTFDSPGVLSSTGPTPEPPVYPAAVPNGVDISSPAFSNVLYFNTGQHPLFRYDYAYDADCGAVGFRKADPAPPHT